MRMKTAHSSWLNERNHFARTKDQDMSGDWMNDLDVRQQLTAGRSIKL